jgi:hypothetical protein
MKTSIPRITIGLGLGDKKHAICVLNQPTACGWSENKK